MAQGQLDRISADAKPVPVTHLPGILERERPGGSQAGKPESSTSHSQGKKKMKKKLQQFQWSYISSGVFW